MTTCCNAAEHPSLNLFPIRQIIHDIDVIEDLRRLMRFFSHTDMACHDFKPTQSLVLEDEDIIKWRLSQGHVV